jgi:phenylalanine-4-hydroxylase
MVHRFQSVLWPEYVDYLAKMRWSRRELPTLNDLNAAIRETGWSTAYVDGYVSSRTIYEHLAARTLPVARSVRSLEHVKYAPQPDMLHDLVGHLPFAFCAEVSELVERIARKALQVEYTAMDAALYKANQRLSTLKTERPYLLGEIAEAQQVVDSWIAKSLADPTPFACVSRLYLWVVEFGFLRRAGKPRAIGAALFSSRDDLLQVVEGRIRLRRLTTAVFHQEVAISGPQASFFVADSMDDVYRLLDSI